MSSNWTETPGPPSWVTSRSAWLASTIAAVDTAASPCKVHDIPVRDGVAAVQQLARIHTANDLMPVTPATVVSQPISRAQPIGIRNDPYAPGGSMGPVPYLPMMSDVEGPPTGHAGSTPSSLPPVPTTPPASTQQPAAISPPAATPPTANPAPETTPAVQHPAHIDPKLVVAIPNLPSLYNLDGSLKSADQLAAEQVANVEAPTANDSAMPLPPNVPFIPGLTGPGSASVPPITVSAQATLPVAPEVVPPAIVNLADTYRVGLDGYGFNYSISDLIADLATVRRGPMQTVVNGHTPYELALARLAAAHYTRAEQSFDLQWAFYDAQTEEEKKQKAIAVDHLGEIGIFPYENPAIEKYIKDQISKAQFLTDPNNLPRNTPPPPLRPKETSLGEDLYGLFVRPAVVLWEAAHGEGNHSGADIAWAAAEFGLNASIFVPGVGTVTGGARALSLSAAELRTGIRLAAALAKAEDSIEAARIGNQFRTQQLLDDIERMVAERQMVPSVPVGALEQSSGNVLPSLTTIPGRTEVPLASESPTWLRLGIPTDSNIVAANGIRRTDVGLTGATATGAKESVQELIPAARGTNPVLTASPSWIDAEFSAIAETNRAFAQSTDKLVEQIKAQIKFENPALSDANNKSLVSARVSSAGGSEDGFNGGFYWAEGHGANGSYTEGAARRRELENPPLDSPPPRGPARPVDPVRRTPPRLRSDRGIFEAIYQEVLAIHEVARNYPLARGRTISAAELYRADDPIARLSAMSGKDSFLDDQRIILDGASRAPADGVGAYQIADLGRWNPQWDSERKILEELGRQLRSGSLGAPGADMKLRMIVDRPAGDALGTSKIICPSCKGIMRQFQEEFGIEIEVRNMAGKLLHIW